MLLLTYIYPIGFENELLTEVQTLLEGGADPDHGQPNAMECIVLFRQEEKWKAKFENASGLGKATPS